MFRRWYYGWLKGRPCGNPGCDKCPGNITQETIDILMSCGSYELANMVRGLVRDRPLWSHKETNGKS